MLSKLNSTLCGYRTKGTQVKIVIKCYMLLNICNMAGIALRISMISKYFISKIILNIKFKYKNLITMVKVHGYK